MEEEKLYSEEQNTVASRESGIKTTIPEVEPAPVHSEPQTFAGSGMYISAPAAAIPPAFGAGKLFLIGILGVFLGAAITFGVVSATYSADKQRDIVDDVVATLRDEAIAAWAGSSQQAGNIIVNADGKA